MILIQNSVGLLENVNGDDVELCVKMGGGTRRMKYWSTLFDMLMAGFCLLITVGCGATELPSPEVSARAAELSALLTSTKTVETKSDEILKVVESNTTALAAIKAKVDALQVESETPKVEEVIKSAPNPPAKANDTQTSPKVATPGDFSQETLVELATRLYGQGVSVHMKTEDQLKAIDAQLKAGQPVTGAIFQNNRASAITSQRSAVRLIPRGKGLVRWQRNSAGQTCGPNGCY
jgi:hypothetical protein